MAKQEQFEENVSKAKEKELDQYQNSLKKKINMLGSCFSILLILVGLFLLVNGLFGIVNRPGVKNGTANIATDNSQLEDEDIAFDQSIKDNGNINGPGGSIGEGLSTIRVKAETNSAVQKAEATQERINRTHRWHATDYSKGDIGIGEYEVKLGDTLWEISEAVYGSGFEWKRILEANKEQIGFLPDKTQALIIPGQKLHINK